MCIKNSDKNNKVANSGESKNISNQQNYPYMGTRTKCVCMYVWQMNSITVVTRQAFALKMVNKKYFFNVKTKIHTHTYIQISQKYKKKTINFYYSIFSEQFHC